MISFLIFFMGGRQQQMPQLCLGFGTMHGLGFYSGGVGVNRIKLDRLG